MLVVYYRPIFSGPNRYYSALQKKMDKNLEHYPNIGRAPFLSKLCSGNLAS